MSKEHTESPAVPSRSAIASTGGIAADLRHDIDRTLDRRLTEPNTSARHVEDVAKRGGTSLWHALKAHPYAGTLASAAVGVALASTIGVGELVVGMALGYAAFKVFRHGERPGKAVKEIVEELGHA